MLSKDQQNLLLKLARDVITARLEKTQYQSPDDPAFDEARGIFVTLHKGADLRGCIGYIQPYKSILESVKEMAIAAAFRDPRFPPVDASELPELSIEISLLSELMPVEDLSQIRIGRDGLYLDHPQGSGLLLPQVAVENRWDLQTFLRHLCLKSGLRPDTIDFGEGRLFRFEAEIFSE